MIRMHGLVLALLIVAAVALTVLLVRAFDSRRMPDLEIWHRQRLEHEFRARTTASGFTFDDYRERELRLFDEIDRKIYRPVEPSEAPVFDRYRRGSVSDPARFEPNWNRTFELEPDSIRGAALVLHGLTDSPYSMRATAALLRDQGFYVLGLRLPGHGTTPGSLARVSRRDWQAAVRIAAAHAAARAGSGPFVLAGYSTGGALAVDYALDSLDDAALRRPDRMILLSPAIGISFFARFANWHKLFSFLPWFEQGRWGSIVAEYDPFKYSSFPKNAGDQVHLLSKALKRDLARLAREGRAGELPPILTFQSVVDATVEVDAVVDRLYAVVAGDEHELVLFDVNRWSSLERFLKGPHESVLSRLRRDAVLPYRLTLVTNVDSTSREVVARSREAGAATWRERPLGLSWPEQVYSLSHVAIPFPPDDPTYGGPAGNPSDEPYHLGTLRPRGERDLLRVAIGQLMRLRHNPFFGFMERKIVESLGEAVPPEAPRGDPPAAAPAAPEPRSP